MQKKQPLLLSGNCTGLNTFCEPVMLCDRTANLSDSISLLIVLCNLAYLLPVRLSLYQTFFSSSVFVSDSVHQFLCFHKIMLILVYKFRSVILITECFPPATHPTLKKGRGKKGGGNGCVLGSDIKYLISLPGETTMTLQWHS